MGRVKTKICLLTQSQKNYLEKLEKSSETGYKKKGLVSIFACFLTDITKV